MTSGEPFTVIAALHHLADGEELGLVCWLGWDWTHRVLSKGGHLLADRGAGHTHV